MNDKTDDTTNQSNSLIDKVTDEMENQINSDEITDQFSKAEINAFNAFFELYSGSQTGLFIETLLNKIVTNNKKEEHIITVIYNDITTAIPDDITTLKENFEDFEEYEVSLDYDTNGFVLDDGNNGWITNYYRISDEWTDNGGNSKSVSKYRRILCCKI